MSRNQQRVADYLLHMLDAIERITIYTAGMDENVFLRSKLVQDAVIRNFEVIGEASHNIEKYNPDFAALHPDIPLSSAYQMRNALSHGYFNIDYEMVWKTICSDLPGLTEKIISARTNILEQD